MLLVFASAAGFASAPVLVDLLVLCNAPCIALQLPAEWASHWLLRAVLRVDWSGTFCKCGVLIGAGKAAFPSFVGFGLGYAGLGVERCSAALKVHADAVVGYSTQCCCSIVVILYLELLIETNGSWSWVSGCGP
ncbi:hypothetical protein Nepgr_024775 [Nepenthes gracilis]|uniref:Secreted protein n=1 Tax=Nepenthes gracilis TaxID=150966 RepID=A0AAD3XYY1_NEPGR|nr:hypothetical protein Nepgr_024775 [Nepenthes gracilis]